MTTPDEPTIDDVIVPGEQAIPDHHEHAKTPKHLDDDELARRTEQERIAAGVADHDPDAVPPAAG